MRHLVHGWLVVWALFLAMDVQGDTIPSSGPVCIIPIREDIMPPLVFLVRRGVKEAMERKAGVLILDMDTHGGRVDVTEEILKILGEFKGKSVTYVNRKAFSAGAFISVATQEIYMAPESVIGAAAPIMLSPGGGASTLPETVEAKMTSGISALIRATAEKNGHNIEVVEAMIDKNKVLTIDGKVLNEKGRILTLTNREAEEKYGTPPKRLLSSGTVGSLEELVTLLGYKNSPQILIQPSGAENLGFWLNKISPILLIIGVIGVYIEFKTPGFGAPGVIGITAFVLYFLGPYIAGISGLEWVLLFAIGLGLLITEIFFFPGTIIVGLIGAGLIVLALVMALVDLYPGMPTVPSLPQLRRPAEVLSWALLGCGILILLLSRFLPKTVQFQRLVSQSASGVATVRLQKIEQQARIGEIGSTVSPLHPGGKAVFNNERLDVVTQGEMISKDTTVRIIGYSGRDAVVEEVRST
jgi:membrane-bound serine protease (ClpP class)